MPSGLRGSHIAIWLGSIYLICGVVILVFRDYMKRLNQVTYDLMDQAFEAAGMRGAPYRAPGDLEPPPARMAPPRPSNHAAH